MISDAGSTTHSRSVTVSFGRFVSFGATPNDRQIAAPPVDGRRLRLGSSNGRVTRSARPTALYFTAKEVQVLEHLSKGRSRAEIALALGIGGETVRTHEARVRAKLKVRRKRELVGFSVASLAVIPGTGGQRAATL